MDIIIQVEHSVVVFVHLSFQPRPYTIRIKYTDFPADGDAAIMPA